MCLNLTALFCVPLYKNEKKAGGRKDVISNVGIFRQFMEGEVA